MTDDALTIPRLTIQSIRATQDEAARRFRSAMYDMPNRWIIILIEEISHIFRLSLEVWEMSTATVTLTTLTLPYHNY